MKKTFFVIASLFMLLMLPLASFGASPGPYVGINLGMSFLSNGDFSGPGETGTLTYDPGFAGTIAGGYNFGSFRAEGEVGYQKNSGQKEYSNKPNASNDMTALSLMANGYYDFINSTPITPFVTAGLGIARLGVTDLGSDANVFAYQFGGGASYNLVENVDIDLTYKYFATADPNFGNGSATFASNNVYLGLKYKF